MIRNFLASITVLLTFCAAAQAASWEPLIDRMAADGHDPERMRTLLLATGPGPDPKSMGVKIRSLYVSRYGSEKTASVQRRLADLGYAPGPADGHLGNKTRGAIALFQQVHGLPLSGRLSPELAQRILASDTPAPKGAKPPALPRPRAVYASIMTGERLQEALAFFELHKPMLASLKRQYGVPPEMAVGVLAVETRMGRHLGEESAFKTLASMAACDDFDSIREYFADELVTKGRKRWMARRIRDKSDWAYKELLALVDYSEQAGLHPLTLPGSIYGAIGISQFMPTNALAFGVDGDGDGVVNLFNTHDALHSMANFMRHHAGDAIHASRNRQRKALYRYNPSRTYVNTVMAVADHLRVAASGR